VAIAEGGVLEGRNGHYVVGAPLGRGGFGETFAATRTSDGAAVVLKLLRIDRVDDAKALELFEREANVLASLDHPGVPRTFDFFLWDGQRAHDPREPATLQPTGDVRWVMVQSRAPGRSLAQRIEANERLEPSSLAALLRSLLAILEYLHGLHPGVVHRDIKPANVMVDEVDGALQVTLVDFGAIQARVRNLDSVSSTSVGTFGFIPLEQMMGQARPASDLYAAAMTLVVAATHRYPDELPLDEHTGKVDLNALGLQLAPAVRATLDTMLEPVVGKRIASATAALQMLDAPVGAAALALPPSQQLSVSGPRYNWLWNGTMGAAGLAAGLIYLVFFNKFSETELIQISAFWVAPLAFGIVGKIAEANQKPNPVATAFAWAGLAVGALIVFIYGIFPAL
jgi:serine/threonine protein kinase